MTDISDVLFVFTLNLSQLTVNYAEVWIMSKAAQYLLQKRSWNRFMKKR
jgi:hypothetical protein